MHLIIDKLFNILFGIHLKSIYCFLSHQPFDMDANELFIDFVDVDYVDNIFLL